MLRGESIKEALDCAGFVLFLALLLGAYQYMPVQKGMHSEIAIAEARP